MIKEFIRFIKNYEDKVIPLTKEYSETFFNASITGNPELYKKSAELELQLTKIHSDKESFSQIKKFQESGEITETVLARELQVFYNTFAGNQTDEELLEKIVKLSNKIEEKYSTFRAKINDKEVNDNEIDKILKESRDSSELKTTWEASKQIGEEVKEDVLTLVRLRNESAKNLGYKNYHEMSLILSELNPAELDKLFDELDEKISDEYSKLKAEMDEYLSNELKIEKRDLRPWHYQDKFMQQGPAIYNVDLDKYYEDKDLVELTEKYFSGIGLEIKDLIEKSDLFEKENKYQHAYCIPIDRENDVRVLCNIKPDYKWMNTMLHEFGHAVYDKYISQELPWLLREQSHIFTTEAIAMLFGRFAADPKWMKENFSLESEEASKIAKDCFLSLRLEQLCFSRWVQVVYRFERSMYADPDQDLNLLWKNLVKKYQLVNYPDDRDAPDWAAKIHIALYPAYYQNYMLGEILASQLYYYINNKVLKLDEEKFSSFTNETSVGEYLKHLFFSYGTLYSWNELIEKSTGEKLNVDYYVNQFLTKE